MKKTFFTIALMAIGIITTTNAAEVNFGARSSYPSPPNWNTPAAETQPDGSITFSLTQDGVTFDLNVRGVTNFVPTVSANDVGIIKFSNGGGVGVKGGTSSSADARISNNTSGNTGDDEYFIFTLSTSGLNLNSLSMNNLHMRYSTSTRNLKFVDQNGVSVSLENTGTDDNYDYGDLPGLASLSTNNISSWSLAVGMIDNAVTAANVVAALGQITFTYEPENSFVSDYSGTLRLGTGETTSESYTNSPVTWDATTANWGVGPDATQSAWTNWIRGSDAIFGGTSNNRTVNLATNLNVVVDEFENAGDSTLHLTGINNSLEIITITNKLRTALAKPSRWISLNDVNVGGTFNVQNVGRITFTLGAGVEAGTDISYEDLGDIVFNGTTTDFNDLTVSVNGGQIFNQSASDKTLGSLSGNGSIRLNGSDTLTINNITVGGISNVASFAANDSSVGNLQLGSGTHNFSINPSTATADQLAIGTGTNIFGGDLVVIAVNNNEFKVGDSFKLFDAGAYAGAFNSVVLPTNNLPAGAEFFTDDLGVDGTISVGEPGVAYKGINFTDFNVSTWEDGLTETSGSITNEEGTIVTLTLSVVAPNTTHYHVKLYETSIAGLGGTGSSKSRLDSGVAAGKADDEEIRFKVSVDTIPGGTPADSIVFQSMGMEYFGATDAGEFSDRFGASVLLTNGGSTVYARDLSGIEALAIDNVDDWVLDLAARESAGDVQSAFSMEWIKFSIGYQVISPFDLWSEGYGLVEDKFGDDDKDGVSNLAEFGLKGDPTNSIDKGVYDIAAVEQGGTNMLEYIHVERKDGSVDYSYVLTGNLVHGPWTTNSGIYEIGSGDYDADYNIVTNQTTTDLDAKFIKLLVEEN